MSDSLTQNDLDKIEQIAVAASASISTTIISQIAKEVCRETITEILQVYGMHDPQKTQKQMNFVDEMMDDKISLRRAFWGGLGGHIASAFVAILAAVAYMKGLGG